MTQHSYNMANFLFNLCEPHALATEIGGRNYIVYPVHTEHRTHPNPAEPENLEPRTQNQEHTTHNIASPFKTLYIDLSGDNES